MDATIIHSELSQSFLTAVRPMSTVRAMPAYRTDLAYIHDRGFSRLAEQAARGIVVTLRRAGIRRGLILDLGCGSGRSSRVFARRRQCRWSTWK